MWLSCVSQVVARVVTQADLLSERAGASVVPSAG